MSIIRKEKELKKLPLELYIDLALLHIERDKAGADREEINAKIRECWSLLGLEELNSSFGAVS